MPDEPLRKIAEGREAEIYTWEGGAVLRLLRNANARQQVEWEAVAMEAARAAGVSVPAVLGTTIALGRPGLIMERVDGVDLLTDIGRRPWTVWSAGRVTGELHARLAGVGAPESVPPLKPALRRVLESSALVPREIAELALPELDALPEGDRLCHGDFHPGNVIVENGTPKVIDWTNVTRGDPDADLARTMLMLRLGDPPPGSPLVIRVGAKFARRILRDAYLRAYRRVRPADMSAVALWEVPVAAKRLADGIAVERPALLRMLEARGKET